MGFSYLSEGLCSFDKKFLSFSSMPEIFHLYPKSHVLTHQNSDTSMSYTSSTHLLPIPHLPGQTMGLPVWDSKFLDIFVTKGLFHFFLGS